MANQTNKVPKMRQRSENWLEEDKHLLMDLVRERVKDIENKNTDTNTNAKKLAAWTDLLSSYNSMCKGSPRTHAQLKSQWGIIKMAKKKTISLETKQVFQTGGGPPPEMDPENPNDITAWLPNEFVIDTNEFDSDQINQIKWEPSRNDLKMDLSTNNSKIQVENVIVEDLEKPKRPTETQEENLQEVTDEVHVIQDQNTQEVNSTNTMLKEPPVPKPLKTSGTGIFKKKKENETKTYAASIAETEVQCRKELHQLQMEN